MNWNASIFVDCTSPVEIERGKDGGTRIWMPFRHSGICEGLAFVPVYLTPDPNSRHWRSSTSTADKGRALPDVRR